MSTGFKSHPKHADPDQPIHDLIANRWSPRAFLDKTIETEQLLSMLEAARWAASSGNGQPWRFLVTHKGTDAHAKLFSSLTEGNKTWAGGAPVLLLSIAETTLVRDGKPTRANRHAFHDVGMAVANMLIQALTMGIYGHQMAGFNAKEARATFNIPKEFEPVAVIALGYLGAPTQLAGDLQEKEQQVRSRKALDTFVFTETFGKTATFVRPSES